MSPRTWPASLLVTPTTWDRWGGRVLEVAPGITPVVFDPAGDGADGGDDGGAPAQMAWVSFDIWATARSAGRWFDRVVAAEGLEWCHTSSAGVDHPAYRAVAERGVTLTASHVSGGPIADYVLRAGLDALQDAGAWRLAQAAGVWQRHGFTEMADTTWLVIGLGSIGAEVVTRARAFGARVVGCRRTPAGDQGCHHVVTPDRLADVVGGADVIVLAAPSAAGAGPLVDRELLARVRPGAVLINVARGQLVDTGAMLEALDDGRLSLAALDVFDQEPLPAGDPLWSHPKVVVTPHDSSSGGSRDERAGQVFLDELARWRQGEPLAGRVEP
jgi:phosphoglycerate dehydrogenase-like enzyme